MLYKNSQGDWLVGFTPAESRTDDPLIIILTASPYYDYLKANPLILIKYLLTADFSQIILSNI